jgi:hypothetical protein
LVSKTPPRANPRIISTCRKRARNPRKINTSILKDLNVLRVSRYRKVIKPIRATPDFRAEVFSKFVAQVVPLILRPEDLRVVISRSRLAALVRIFSSRPSTQHVHLTPAEYALTKKGGGGGAVVNKKNGVESKARRQTDG